MPTCHFTHGRIRQADWDPDSGRLELRWDDGRRLAYRGVPAEVFRRLRAAPNPTTYWEDRIAEEYPQERVGTSAPGGGAADARRAFGDLFGAGGSAPGEGGADEGDPR